MPLLALILPERQVFVYTNFVGVAALRLLNLECYKFRYSLTELTVVLLSADDGASGVPLIACKPYGGIRSVAQFSQDEVSPIKKGVS